MDDTNWLEPDDDRPTRDRRRRRLAVLALIPWLVVVGLLVIPRTGAGTDPADPASSDPASTAGAGVHDPGDSAHHTDARPPAGDGPVPDAGPIPPEATDATSATAPDVIEAVEVRGRWRLTPGVEEAASLGVVVARAALTGVAPVLAIDGVPTAGSGRYAEHLVVEAVEHTGSDAVTVTVLAIVLTTGEELAAEVVRLAVPVTLDGDGAHPAGSPWQLPAPSLTPRPPELEPLEDTDEQLQVAEALTAAGLEELELTSVLAAEGGPTVALTRSTDGEQHTVWLRRHLDGFVVAGTPLARSGVGSGAAGDADNAQGVQP